MNLKPLHNRIIVKRIESEEKKGSIIIPDTAKEKPNEGIILAVGEGTYTDNGELIPLNVKVGEKILFNKYGVTEVEKDDETLLIIKESDVLAIIE